MIMLKWIDKELSFSVYLKSRNNMIELYKHDSDYVLYSIMISCDKGITIFTVNQVMSDYRPSHDLGSHNVLLEATYDLWA